MKIITKSARATKLAAAKLAHKIIKFKPGKTASVIGLIGELGAGKTTFIQGFIKMLGVRQRVMSPTFLIFRPYPIKNRFYSGAYHADLYRIRSFTELEPLGFRKILSNPQNIVLIEWAGKIKRSLPKTTFWINFRHGENQKARIITYENQF